MTRRDCASLPESGEPGEAARTGIGRRAVLGTGATAAGVVLLAAGCGTAANGGAATAGQGEPSAAAPAPVPAIVLGPASEVPVGGAMFYPTYAAIVVQPTAGTFHGFSNICPHNQCAVSILDGEALVCPCHGSRFAFDGSVLQGPALSGLYPVRVSVTDGQLTVG